MSKKENCLEGTKYNEAILKEADWFCNVIRERLSSGLNITIDFVIQEAFKHCSEFLMILSFSEEGRIIIREALEAYREFLLEDQKKDSN